MAVFAFSIESWAFRQFGPLIEWEFLPRGSTYLKIEKFFFFLSFLFIFLNSILISMIVLLANFRGQV